MKASKHLAQLAKERSNGWKLTKGETTEAKQSTLIQLYVDNATTYQGIEGVRINRAPKPVRVEVKHKANPTVKKMFTYADLINEDGHIFDNIIILN